MTSWLHKFGQFTIGLSSNGKRDFLHGLGLSVLGLSGLSLFALSLPSLAEPQSNALPTGLHNTTGISDVNVNGNIMNVNADASRSIANWQSFNIGSAATVNFNLPSANSAILNRVAGGSVSEIFGKINSNGSVFITNPSGILFGSSSQINVGSLFASTLDIKNTDFLQAQYNFARNSNPTLVQNDGTINVANGGFVGLFGGAVKNTGTINAPNGQIHLAIGDKISVPVEQGIAVDVIVDKPLSEKVQEVKDGIENLGLLRAQAGLVKLQANLQEAIYTNSINNKGRIEATGITNKSGVIELIGKSEDQKAIVLNSGDLIANNEEGHGGTIHVFGDYIGLIPSSSPEGTIQESTINASGKTGGGEILIGGDYQGTPLPSPLTGKSPSNAQKTYIGSKVNIYADAKETGNGGKVIVWADDSTQFDGNISAKGGSHSGNGGFAEVSGKNSLIARGEYDLSAPHGEFGTLLFDPLNIQIVGGSADGSDQGNAVNTQLQNNPGSNTLGTISFADEGLGTPDPFIIFESEIEGTNANIVLQARNGITTSGTFGGSEVLIQNNRNLTMQTQNLLADGTSGINLTGSTHGNSLLFRTQGTGTIALQSNTGGVSTAPIITGGLQTANQGISLQSNGGNISLNGITNSGTAGLTLNSNGGNITQSGAITAGNLTLSTAAGNATLTNTSNNITTLLASSTGGNISYTEALNQSFALGSSSLGLGDLTLTAQGSGSITQTGAASSGNTLTVNSGSGNITLNTFNNDFNTFAGTSTVTSTVAYRDDNGFDVAANNRNAGNLTLQSTTGNITQSGAITANILNVQTTSGDGILTNSSNNITTLLASSTGGNISYIEGNGQSFSLGTSTLSGGGDLTLQVSIGGSITQTGAVTADILSVTSELAPVSLNNLGNNINSLVANSTGVFANISYTEALNQSFALGNSSVGLGSLTLTTSGTGSITQSGSASGNTLTVNTGTGSATLNAFNNDFNTFAGTSTSTGTISYRDDNGFIVGLNNRGTANLSLQSGTGNITQSGAITANILNVQTTSGDGILTNSSNNISTLQANSTSGNISYTEASGQNFVLGTSALGIGSLTLTTLGTGAITQSGAASGDLLAVNTGTGSATLNTFNNDFFTFAGTSTSTGTIAYRDDNGFAVGTNNRGTANLTLQSNTGAVGQSGAITAGNLTVSSTLGNATLTNSANNVTTLLVSSTGGNISYREADGQSFTLGTSTLSGGGDLTLQVGGAGTITQSGAVTADVLNITTASGNATLGTAGNNINNLVANSTSGTIAYVEGINNSFDLSASNLGTGNLTLTTSGTGSMTQSAISTGNILTVNTGTGNATFNTVNNDFNTFGGTSTSTGTIAYRDDNGFAVGTNGRGTANLTLQSTTGNITQTGAVTANILNVTSTSGNATLTNSANNITTLLVSGTGGNISYRESDGQSFALGASTLSGGGDLSLQIGGSSALTQTGAVVADVLNITAGTSGTSTLTNTGNDINTLNIITGNASVTYREGDNQAFDISGASLGTGTLTLQTGGTSNITQSGSITAGTLNTSFGSGNVILNNASNSLGTLISSSTGGNLQYTESTNDNLILGVNNLGIGDLSINLSGTGVLTQSGAITADILNIDLGSSGNSVLSTSGNNINTLNATSTGANLTYTETTNQNFNLGTANFTGGGDLSIAVSGTGILTASSPIVADVLFVTTGTNATTISNATIDTFRANSAGGLVTFNADPNQSFNLGTSAMTGFGDLTLNLSGSGVVTQTGALTGVDILTVNAGTSGNNILTNSGNDVSTLFVNGNGGNVSYLEKVNGFFNLGSSNLTTGNLDLTVSGSGTIAQSGSLIADTLSVSSGSGGITFTNVSNNINSLTATSTSGSISFTDANGFSVNASNVGSGGLTLTGGNTPSANIDVLGMLSGNNISIAAKNNGNINLGANLNGNTSVSLSTLTNGNINAGTHTINSPTLTITTVSGHASQDGMSGGAAINTNISNFAGNTTGGTIRINDIDSLSMNTSAVAGGSLFVSNSAGNINVNQNVTATTGQLNFSAFDDLIIDKLSTNLSFTTSATGSMSLTSGRDILIGSNATSGNLNVDGGFQTVNAGRDLIVTGRGVTGAGGYSRLQGIGNGTAQNITTGRDLIIQMSTATTGDNNFSTIATTSATGNQLINVGGELKVLGGIDNNSVSTSSARLSSTAAQNITVNGNITVQGGSGNNNTAIISAASTQNITSNTGSINVLGGSGTNSPGRILTTANSIALPSTINATTGGINIGTNGGILAIANAGTLTLNGGTGGININGNAQGGVGNQLGSLTLNVSGGANISQTGGAVNGGTLNILTNSGNANLINADFTTLTGSSNGGAFNYSDTDGFTLGNMNLGGGDLTAIAFAPLLTASNAFAEANMTVTGNITNINNATLTANGTANITQSAGSLIANNLTINVNSGDATLNQANNNIVNLTSSIGAVGGSIQYTDLNDVNISTVSGFANLTGGNTFGVTANGNITGVDLLGAIITGGGNLSFLADNDNNGSGAISIGGNLNSSGGNISLKGAGLLLPFNLASGSGIINLTSTVGNNISQGLGTSITGTTLNTTIGSGTANLTNTTNDVTNFSATSSLGGTVNFVDANSFNVNASNMGTGNLSLKSAGGGIGAGDITQSSNIIANRLDLQIGSGTANLFNPGNNINILGGSAANGNITMRDENGGFTTDNISVGNGNLFLRSSGGPGLSQIGGSSLTGNNLTVQLLGGSQAVLTNIGNDFNNITFSAQASTASYYDANGFNLLSADMDSNVFGAVGNLSLATDTGNITQSGAIKTDNLTISTNSGDVILTDNTNDLNDLTINAMSGNVTLIDSDGLTINTSNFGSGNLSITADATGLSTNRSAGSAPPPINGIGTQLSDGGNLDNEFGINLAGNISGTGNLSLTVSDPNNVNGINQLSGSVSGNGLTLSTTGGNITINNADFISLTSNTNGGNLSFADRDGLILNNISTNGGSLSIITNQISNTANNGVTENNLDLNGIISSGAGNSTLTVNGIGNLTQSGGSISGNGLTLTLNTGNANINTADFATLAGSSNGGNLSFADSDGLILNSLNIGSGIATISVETGALVTNGIVESNLDLAGNLSFGSATLTANLGNIIQSSGLISSTGNLSLNTNGGNAIINNSDVISLSGNTAGGNLTYADTDGVILGSLNTGAGDLIVSTGSGSLANNFISENNLSVLGPVNGSNITLSSLVLGADLNLNASTMQAINSLILNSNGNINGNSLINFPKLIAPNVQITATGLIGSSNSPIGIQTAGLLPTSFIDDQGRGAFLNQMSILNLSQDISSLFNLYPIYIIPSNTSVNNLMINTIAMEQSVYNSERKFNHSLSKKEGLYGTRIHIVDETYIQKPYSVLFNDSWAAFEGMRDIKEN